MEKHFKGNVWYDLLLVSAGQDSIIEFTIQSSRHWWWTNSFLSGESSGLWRLAGHDRLSVRYLYGFCALGTNHANRLYLSRIQEWLGTDSRITEDHLQETPQALEPIQGASFICWLGWEMGLPSSPLWTARQDQSYRGDKGYGVEKRESCTCWACVKRIESQSHGDGTPCLDFRPVWKRSRKSSPFSESSLTLLPLEASILCVHAQLSINSDNRKHRGDVTPPFAICNKWQVFKALNYLGYHFLIRANLFHRVCSFWFYWYM